MSQTLQNAITPGRPFYLTTDNRTLQQRSIVFAWLGNLCVVACRPQATAKPCQHGITRQSQISCRLQLVGHGLFYAVEHQLRELLL